MYLNVKQDYLNINDSSEYQKLLDGEYRWMDTGAVVDAGINDASHKTVRSEMMGVKSINQWEWATDPGCRMYEIGFTRAEVLKLTGWKEPGHEPKEWIPYEPPENVPEVVTIDEEIATLKSQIAVLTKAADKSKLTAEDVAVLTGSVADVAREL